MRVLILSNMYPSEALPYSGIFVRNQVEIIREQSGPAWNVTCAAMNRRLTGLVGSILKYLRFAVRCLPHLFRRYDIVHVHYLVPLGLFGAIYRRLHPTARLVVTFHGSDVGDRHFDGIRGRIWRAVGAAVDHGIAVGPGVAASVRRHLALDRIDVRPAGIDSRKFYADEDGATEKRYDFLFVGWLSESKGVDLLLEALRDDRLRAARVAFAGDGPLRGMIESRVDRHDFELLGSLDQTELRRIYQSSRFLVLPSRSEGFGLVVGEAMFCGVPAIVSDLPGPMSQLNEGVNGLSFAAGSARDLANALSRGLEMDAAAYARMAAEALRSNRRFDIYVVTRELIDEYSRLVDS